MGKLGAPRACEYEFWVFRWDHEVVLVDRLEVYYYCSGVSCYDVEALYEVSPEPGTPCFGATSYLECDRVVPETLHDDGGTWTCPSCGHEHDGLSKHDNPLLLRVRDADRHLKAGGVKVELDPEYLDPRCPREEAWDAAREEACANHLI